MLRSRSDQRRALLAGLALATAQLLAACGGSAAAAPKLGAAGEITPVGERVPGPGLSGPQVTGGTYDFAAQRGHVVVINAFGSWCGPCQEEAPALAVVAKQTMPTGVRFVGLTVRDTPDKAAAFASTYGLGYPVVQDDDGGLAARLGGQVVPSPPTTLVIDKQGRLAARFLGPVLGSQLRDVVDRVAAEQT